MSLKAGSRFVKRARAFEKCQSALQRQMPSPAALTRLPVSLDARTVGTVILLGAIVIAVIVLVTGGHAEIVNGALGNHNGHAGGGSAKLVSGANKLASDGTAILVPTVTLASAAGGIAWALGSQRGQGIVVGALIAGVAGLTVKLIAA